MKAWMDGADSVDGVLLELQELGDEDGGVAGEEADADGEEGGPEDADGLVGGCVGEGEGEDGGGAREGLQDGLEDHGGCEVTRTLLSRRRPGDSS